MPQIDTFLFDVGNVLVEFDFRIASHGLRPFCEGYADPMEPLVPLRDELEVGGVSGEEFVVEAIDRIGFAGTPEEFVRIYQSIFTPVPAIWELVGSLRGRYRLLLLSNTSDLHHEGLVRDFPIFEAFEGGAFSYSARSAKPDPSIYKQVIDGFELDPERTIYLDDLPENIARGEEFRLRCHRYDKAEHGACLRLLQSLGVGVGDRG